MKEERLLDVAPLGSGTLECDPDKENEEKSDGYGGVPHIEEKKDGEIEKDADEGSPPRVPLEAGPKICCSRKFEDEASKVNGCIREAKEGREDRRHDVEAANEAAALGDKPREHDCPRGLISLFCTLCKVGDARDGHLVASERRERDCRQRRFQERMMLMIAMPTMTIYLDGETSCIGVMLWLISRSKPAAKQNIAQRRCIWQWQQPRVPFPMELPGSLRSPERFAPSMMPVIAGNMTPKTRGQLHDSTPRRRRNFHWA